MYIKIPVIDPDRLLDLKGARWELVRGKLRLARTPTTGLDVVSRSPPNPSDLLLVCEMAFGRALTGMRLGRDWRTGSPREFLACAGALAGPIFWRAGAGGPSLAHYCDEIADYGRLSFYVSNSGPTDVLAALAREDVRTRATAVVAIGTLLLKPEALEPLLRKMPDQVTTGPNAFARLVEHLNPGQLSVLVEQVRSWPGCIATPFCEAWRAAAARSESHLFRSDGPSTAPTRRLKWRKTAPVSSIALR